jgi:hypothetical protein
MFYKITPYSSTDDKVLVPKQFTLDNDLADISTCKFTLSCGQRKCNCDIVVQDDLEKDTIKIPEHLINLLYLPKDIKFQVKINNNIIQFGPIIGLLFKKSKNKLNKIRLTQYLKYALDYSKTNGILCVFASESINFEKSTVEGFYYNPESNKWISATLPIPDSIFRRTSLPQNIFNKLSNTTKNKVFNSYFFNKWEFWKTGLKDNVIKNHIPYTEIINSPEGVIKQLEKYNFLYLKPINGTFSKGIVRLEKEDDKYLIKTNSHIKPLVFNSNNELINYLLKLVSNKTYLAQQGVNVIKLTDGYTSLRVIMQKNKHLKWQCTGIIARIGESRGISSNYNSWGYGLTLEDFLSKSHQLSEYEIAEKRREVINICTSICNMIEKTWGNYGDVGIDIGIDKDLNVWIFEVNKTHMHYIPLKINDYKMYNKVKTTPIEYAVALSGFKVMES